MPITRLAPSPTGALHLGNARTFLINWILARRNGWKILLRIEDIDGPRIKAGADLQAIEDLQWLGIDWDEGPIYQIPRLPIYRDAIERLLKMKLAYPCVCSRKEVELAASAPHAEDGPTIYPGTCRGQYETIEDARRASGKEPAIRFAVPDQNVEWHDLFAGAIAINTRQFGDFVIAKADGTPAYQLAVVVDDAEMGVTHVVRGDDLIDSTPRQMLLYQALGMGNRMPEYMHLPLVVGEDGRRLAKRHGDTRISTYRECGVSPQRVLGLMAKWYGIGQHDEIDLNQMLEQFDIQKMPREKIIFTASDDLR
ncbi:MAG TPA: glutamate--tRNA ligase [Tepidisphaeraceae bacterium]|nr:glutamate--tRNA ligase [Tepidisphaeraceae bacterium]